MSYSPRTLLLVTVAHVAVFAASTWWAGGLRGDGLVLELALIAANTLPLLLLGRNPVAVVLALTVAYPTWLITDHASHILQSLPALTALYATGEWSRPLRIRAVALLCPAFMVASALTGWWEDVDPLEIGYIGIVFVVVWALGVLIAARRDHVTELEAKNLRLEQAERALAEQAVAQERSRIARELHDVVAHAMSVITVQAGVGAHLIDTRPAQAGEALRIIEKTGRQAMEEMRRMLSVLQGSGEAGSQAPPQPGLADIDRLITQAEAAGVEVNLSSDGASVGLTPGLDLAAYRVVQEALTNAAKHAPTAPVDLLICRSHGRLVIDVLSRGVEAVEFRAGQGLRGMAERVELYDGELDAGHDVEGFRVRAAFPLEGEA